MWDADGREYLDTIMALGAVALGYGHPVVHERVVVAAEHGVVGPLAPVLELEVAERLAAVLPGVEWLRFLKTGAEAVAAAVRISRAATGRERVLTCGYHGWLDWCQTGPGIPEGTTALRREIRFNDVDDLHAALDAFGPVACIVVEPVIDGPPTDAWLRALRDAATKSGACLVFDEIKTAFRVARGGMAERSGVMPDMMVVGKALGNGFPIAAVGGRQALHASVERVWISSTLATEMVGLAAASAVLDVFETDAVVATLSETGDRLFAAMQRLAGRFPGVVTGVRGIPQMHYLTFVSESVSGAVSTQAARRGLLFKRSAYNFAALPHDATVVETIESVLQDVLEGLS